MRKIMRMTIEFKIDGEVTMWRGMRTDTVSKYVGMRMTVEGDEDEDDNYGGGVEDEDDEFTTWKRDEDRYVLRIKE